MEVEERKWENLASDCLVCIFCYVGLEELAVALPFVCKSWYEASLDPRCWKKLDFVGLDFRFRRKFERRFDRQYGFMSPTFSFPSFMKLCVDRSRGSAVELSIPGFRSDLSLQNLITASIGCPRLKVLSFYGVLQQDEKHLPELIRKWKELEILKIAQKPFFSILEIFEQISMNCPNFRGLHLHGFFNTTETRAIVRCMPRLKILAISGSVICKENLMEILDGCKELEVLDVSYCGGFDVDDEILKKASKVNKFECEGATSKGNMVHDSLIEEKLFCVDTERRPEPNKNTPCRPLLDTVLSTALGTTRYRARYNDPYR